MRRAWVQPVVEYVRILRKRFSHWWDNYGTEKPFVLPLFVFEQDKDMREWRVTSDQSFGGESRCEFIRTDHATAVFRGTLDNRVPALAVDSGFCSIKTALQPQFSFDRGVRIKLNDYDGLRMRFRGDGRPYWFTLFCDSPQVEDLFMLPIETMGGPRFYTVDLPFDEFLLTARGIIQADEQQMTLNNNAIRSFGLTIQDRKDGPFQMEISWIYAYRSLRGRPDSKNNS